MCGVPHWVQPVVQVGHGRTGAVCRERDMYNGRRIEREGSDKGEVRAVL